MRIVEPYDHIHKLRVKPQWAGMSLIDLFHSRFGYISRETLVSKIENGDILVDDRRVEPGHSLKENSLLKHLIRGRTEPAVSNEIPVLFEDDALLVVVKPAPMPVHPCGRYLKNSLSYILEEARPGMKLFTTHRLDSLTSGIVIFAKTKEAAALWSRMFAEGQVEKTYLAGISGSLDSEMKIDAPIRRKNAYLFECNELGKEALTHVRPYGENVVECLPKTGRTHQIRLHLSHAGIPIENDPWYNSSLSSDRDVNRLYEDQAISLYAWKYKTPDQEFIAPLPSWVG